MNVQGEGTVWVHVCKSKKKNGDGLICHKETIGQATKKSGLALRVQGEVLRLPRLLAQHARARTTGRPTGSRARTAPPTAGSRARPSSSRSSRPRSRAAARPDRLLGLELRRLARRALPARGARRGAGSRATRRVFDTVEVNSTFYRLARPAAVARWVEQTPPDFVFAVKASRYLTHVKRLTDMEQGVERLYAGIAPLVESRQARAGAVAAAGELPPRRRPARVRARAAAARPPLLRVPARELVRVGGLRPAAHVRRRARARRRPAPPAPAARADHRLDATCACTAGAAGGAGTTPRRSCARGPERIRELRRDVEVFAYFNNDWEGFAVRNGERLKRCSRGLEPRRDGASVNRPAPRGGAAR